MKEQETRYKLPNMEFKFKVASKGKETQLNWTGEFTYRRPTLGERGQIDVLRASLNQDLRTVDEDVKYLHSALAHLRFTLKDYPSWWEDSMFGTEFYDTNVITDIYDAVIKFEAKWRTKTLGGDAEEVEESAEEKSV